MRAFRFAGEFLINIPYFVASLVMSIMPKRRDFQSQACFGWEEFRLTTRWRHVILATINVITTLGIVIFLYNQTAILRITLIGAVAKTINFIVSVFAGRALDYLYFLGPAFILLLSGNKSSPAFFREFVSYGSGSLPRAAMREELIFRSGSEKWNLIQKLRSSISFGFLHFNNLIYPLAACIAITYNGLFYILIYGEAYKRTGSVDQALKESATVHTWHNLIAITVLLIAVAKMIFDIVQMDV